MKNPLHYCLILTVLFMFQIACTHENASPPDCVELFIERADVIPILWQKSDCSFMILHQYEWKEEIYFMWDHPCADMLPWPNDCEGNALAASNNDPIIGEFLKDAISLGIVGIHYF